MKKLFIPIICSSVVLLSAGSVSAKPELLKTADVLCNPIKYRTEIKGDNGDVLFTPETLAIAIANHSGGFDECMITEGGSVYIFTPISEQKEKVYNPLPLIRIEEDKIVNSISLKPITGDAYRKQKKVLSGKVDPGEITQPVIYRAIVEINEKNIKREIQVPKIIIEPKKGYTHILQ